MRVPRLPFASGVPALKKTLQINNELAEREVANSITNS